MPDLVANRVRLDFESFAHELRIAGAADAARVDDVDLVLEPDAVAQHRAGKVLTGSRLFSNRLTRLFVRGKRRRARQTNHERERSNAPNCDFATPGRGRFRYSRHRGDYRHDSHKPIE